MIDIKTTNKDEIEMKEYSNDENKNLNELKSRKEKITNDGNKDPEE